MCIHHIKLDSFLMLKDFSNDINGDIKQCKFLNIV